MAEENNQNKLITAFLAIIIILAALTVVYVSLPKDDDNQSQDGTTDDEEDEPEVLLKVSYGESTNEYTLDELIELESYNCDATMIKTKLLPNTVITEGPNNYKGVKMTTILEQFDNLPTNYSLIVNSTDDWTTEYSKDNVTGVIDIYNETGEIIRRTGATMIIAYMINDEYYSENSDGPLRIIFCDEDYTPSNLWAKMIYSIDIIKE